MRPAPASDLTFHTVDYVVFVLFLIGFSAVGVWTGLKGIIRQARLSSGEQKDQGNQRELSVVAVSFSLLASLYTSPILLGSPAEIYLHGSDYMFIVFGYLFGAGFATHFIHRRMYNLKLTSVYEYFELRFSFVVRLVGVIVFMLLTLVVLASTIYGPGLVLSEVMGVPAEVSVIVVGLVGTIYITIGGLKGVVWVDVCQMLLIFIISVGILAVGCSRVVGGMATVFDVSIHGGRLTTPSVDPNPLLRMTVWTQVIGGSVSIASLYSTQFIAQKTLALPSMKLVYRGSLVGVLLSNLYLLIGCLIGFVMYTYNFFCDPISTQKVTNPDQLLPYYVMQIFNTPGVAGLFAAASIGSTLSAVGSGVNALAALTMLNMVGPLYKRKNKEDLFETRPFIAALILKIIAAIWGVVTVIAAYVAGVVNKELMQLYFSFLGVFPAPLLGTFILGIFVPFANHWGALAGLLSSLALVVWMFLGSMMSGMAQRAGAPYPLIDICPNVSMSDYSWDQLNTSSWTSETKKYEDYLANASGLDHFYGISFMYYGLVAIVVNIVVGIAVSLFTNICDKRYNTNPKLGYQWWLKSTEVAEKDEESAEEQNMAKARAIQTVMTAEAKAVTSKLTSDNTGVAQRKESHKLKRLNSSSSFSSLNKKNGSALELVIHEETEEEMDTGIEFKTDNNYGTDNTYSNYPPNLVIAEGIWCKI